MSEVNVVIATCNRKNLLLNVLKNLSMQRRIPDLVIIVDSSKSSNLLFYEEYSKLNYEVIYITSNIKSAARQRNIALDYLPKTTDFFVVIDDDITFNEFFLENLIKIMAEDSIVGASGLAINPNKKNRSIKLNILKRLFLLWSPKQGSVTLSGINIPVTASDGDEERLQVEWLIGCSIWNYKMVKDLRYKSEFKIGRAHV
mgnify:CR=1 FL=1